MYAVGRGTTPTLLFGKHAHYKESGKGESSKGVKRVSMLRSRRNMFERYVWMSASRVFIWPCMSCMSCRRSCAPCLIRRALPQLRHLVEHGMDDCVYLHPDISNQAGSTLRCVQIVHVPPWRGIAWRQYTICEPVGVYLITDWVHQAHAGSSVRVVLASGMGCLAKQARVDRMGM